MAYLSLYRKYRSQSFGELIGQDHVVKTLQNALDSGKIAHSYLFTGPRGTGKTSTARLLAKALCCEQGPKGEPCNECEPCMSITNGSCLDVFEMDAASESGVDEIRASIVESVEYKPTFCRYRIFIIDEVHDLSNKAFDALLKTIEEPPDHVVFILATTEFSKVPPTIRSRCQKYEFHRASTKDLMICLEGVAKAEGAEVDQAALALIARMADGGYRDALTLLEQTLLVGEGRVTTEAVFEQLGLIPDEAADAMLLAVRGGNVSTIVELVGKMTGLGRDPRSIVESLLYRLADLTHAAFGLDQGEESARVAALHATSAQIGRDQLLQLRSAVAEIHLNIRSITLPRIWLESQLIKLAIAGTEPATSPASAPRPAPAASPPPPRKTPVEHATAAPATTPTPQPAATPVAAPSADPMPAPAAETMPNHVNDLWSRVIGSFPTRDGQRPPIAMRLMRGRVVEENGTNLTVEMAAFDYEWMQGDPKRRNFVIDALKKVTSKDYQVDYRLAVATKSENVPAETVELPLDGQRLAEKAREILGGSNES